jgi:hypothetical protein
MVSLIYGGFMLTRTRILLLIGVVAALLITLWLVVARNCPSAGFGLTSKVRNLHRLKNRTAFPQISDFDLGITLDKLLQPGDDTNRWSINRAARVQGEVIDVAYAGTEAANCFHPCRRDIHILIANRKGAAKNEQVVLEVTPHLRDWAAKEGMDWSEKTLHTRLVGHWCEFEGWLYFDVGHAEESENSAPDNPSNWRATAWEIHPITKITIIR